MRRRVAGRLFYGYFGDRRTIISFLGRMFKKLPFMLIVAGMGFGAEPLMWGTSKVRTTDTMQWTLEEEETTLHITRGFEMDGHESIISPTNMIYEYPLSNEQRMKIKKIIIGPRITKFEELCFAGYCFPNLKEVQFDDYPNSQLVSIGRGTFYRSPVKEIYATTQKRTSCIATF